MKKLPNSEQDVEQQAIGIEKDGDLTLSAEQRRVEEQTKLSPRVIEFLTPPESTNNGQCRMNLSVDPMNRDKIEKAET